MRTRTPIAAVLLAGLALAGCSVGTTPTPDKATAATPTVSKQDQFLAAIHGASIQSWATAAPTDDEIAAYPQQWCDQLAAGHSLSTILGVRSGLYPSGDNWGTQISDTYQVVILGVTAYCPQYRAQVVQEAQASGNY
jgi:hypothetical protein